MSFLKSCDIKRSVISCGVLPGTCLSLSCKSSRAMIICQLRSSVPDVHQQHTCSKWLTGYTHQFHGIYPLPKIPLSMQQLFCPALQHRSAKTLPGWATPGCCGILSLIILQLVLSERNDPSSWLAAQIVCGQGQKTLSIFI